MNVREASLRVASSKKIFEFRPDLDWDKGRALHWLLCELGLESQTETPMYPGDDTTAEDAFRVIRRRGIGIVAATVSHRTHTMHSRTPARSPRSSPNLPRSGSDESLDVVLRWIQPDEEALREALCTLGNGYFSTRGAAPESVADDVHYPGTYVAGLYNRLVTQIAGRDMVNEDLVNLPNWLHLRFRVADGHWLALAEARVEDYRQELDLRQGVLSRLFVFHDQ